MKEEGASFGGVRKGAWTEEEDDLLRDCIDKCGLGEWHKVPLRAGIIPTKLLSTDKYICWNKRFAVYIYITCSCS